MCGEKHEEGWFDKGFIWKVGVGDKTRFWHDDWVDDKKLINLFPRLFILSEQKDDLVINMRRWFGGGNSSGVENALCGRVS